LGGYAGCEGGEEEGGFDLHSERLSFRFMGVLLELEGFFVDGGEQESEVIPS
jgi:hypothetical protein